MSAGFVIVHEIACQDSPQVGFVEHDDMVDTLSADTADQAFNVRILPWRSWRRDDFFDAHVHDALAEVNAVDPVAVSEQEARRFVIRKGLDNLLACPTGSWMGRDVEMNDATAIMPKDNEAVQQLKSNGRHDKEIDRRYIGCVILKECPPRL